MAKKKGKRPDYQVSIIDKETEQRGVIGAAWIQEDGRIGIQINPFIIIDGAHLNDRYIITLFPRDAEMDVKDYARKISRPELSGTHEDPPPF